MTSLHASNGFSVAGLFAGLTVLAGVAVLCGPLLERRIEARARGAGAAADRIESTLGAGFDRLESLARTYGRVILAPPSDPAGPPPLPRPLPASPVEPGPRWLPPLYRPLPRGLPPWRPWRRRAPPVVWRLR